MICIERSAISVERCAERTEENVATAPAPQRPGHAVPAVPRCRRATLVDYYNNGIVHVWLRPMIGQWARIATNSSTGCSAASRALVAVAARSLATVADDVTLPQYRVLIELASRGPLRLADLARRAEGGPLDRHADVRPAGAQAAGHRGGGRAEDRRRYGCR